MSSTYDYEPRILAQLAVHGLKPTVETAPIQLRDAVSDLYRYEIRRLRSELLANRIQRHRYSAHVIELRKRYWVLSVPLDAWLLSRPPGSPASASNER